MRQRLWKDAAMLSSVVGVSRVLGLVREMVFSALFGASGSVLSDAFFVAYRIPNLFRTLLVDGVLSASLVTTFSATLEQEGLKRLWVLAGRVINWLSLLVGGLVLFGIFQARWIVNLVAPGFANTPEKDALTAQLTQLLWPFLFFLSLASVARGVLNAQDRYRPIALSQLLFNLSCFVVGIPLAWLLDPSFGRPAIFGWATGVLLGGAAQALVLFPLLFRSGFRLRLELTFQDPGLRRILRLMAPSILGAAATPINLVVNERFASTIANGAVSWLYYAYRLIHLPLGIFSYAIATVSVPSLSRAAARGDQETFRRELSSALRLILFLFLPTMAGMIVLAEPIAAVVYRRGRFSALDAEMVAQAIRFYALGLIPFGANGLLAMALYALDDARRPSLISLFSIGTNFLLGWTATYRLGWGHWGLALALSLFAWINGGLLLLALRHHVGPLRGYGLSREGGKSLLAAAGMAGATWAVQSVLGAVLPLDRFFGALLILLGAGTVGLWVFYEVTRRLHAQELSVVLGLLRRRRPRRSSPQNKEPEQ
ncbi:MAG: putative lipid II flippase MurJ [Candidatus Poribacteria bacterium]|nr:MAG: putative lipid II flippase MurJ [Candidatus Poribacteria bacterium]